MRHRWSAVPVLMGLFVSAAPVLAADLPAELPELEKEGEKWFNVAGNTDLSISDRNEARKNAWVNLYKAKEILDRHWDDHPGDQNRIEDRLMKVGQMVFWLKKESPMGVLESTGVGPKKEAAGTQASDWGPKPPEPKPGYAPGEDPGGMPAPPSRNPFDRPEEKPAGAGAPAAPKGPTIEEAYAAVDAYAKKHRADLPGIAERFHALMAAFNEMTSHSLFLLAAQRAGAAQAALKDVYRVLRNEDPDSLKNVDNDDVTRMLVVLGRELKSQDSAVRERASGLIGFLGSGEGAYPLVAAMKREKGPQALMAMGASVVAIGGRKAAEHLGSLRKEDQLAGTGLDLLLKLSQKNPVDKRLAVAEIGAFALVKDESVADRAVDSLIAMGSDGVQGLLNALETRNVETRIKVIGALAATKDPRVAGPLSNFLIGGDVENTIRCREAAMEAIKSFGEPGVPYLFRGLRNPRTKQYTGLLLYQITGQRFSSSRPGDWIGWWKRTHPDWEEGKE